MADLGIVGVGAIAEAIVSGLCDGADTPPSIVLSPRNEERVSRLTERHPTVSAAGGNQAVVDGARTVIVAVRGQDAERVISELEIPAGCRLVSVMAGVPVANLTAWAAPAEVSIAIPLQTVATRSTITPVMPARSAARDLFDRLGGTLPTDDPAALEAITASTATLAAHVRYLQTITAWLTGRGIAEPEASRFVATTFAALGESLQAEHATFERVVAELSTPGGLNEQFAEHLRSAGVYDDVVRALDAVLERVAGPEAADG